MARLFAAMDVATTSSVSGEAFPVVVVEAMASRTPCVVTDVGDSALIVDKTGSVVPPRDPDALAEAWRKLIEAGPGARHNLGMAARRRVQQYFALPVIVDRHQAIYSHLAAGTNLGVSAANVSHGARQIHTKGRSVSSLERVSSS